MNLADGICKFHGIGFRSPDESIDLEGFDAVAFLGVDGELASLAGEIKGAYEAERASFE